MLFNVYSIASPTSKKKSKFVVDALPPCFNNTMLFPRFLISKYLLLGFAGIVELVVVAFNIVLIVVVDAEINDLCIVELVEKLTGMVDVVGERTD